MPWRCALGSVLRSPTAAASQPLGFLKTIDRCLTHQDPPGSQTGASHQRDFQPAASPKIQRQPVGGSGFDASGWQGGGVTPPPPVNFLGYAARLGSMPSLWPWRLARPMTAFFVA